MLAPNENDASIIRHDVVREVWSYGKVRANRRAAGHDGEGPVLMENLVLKYAGLLYLDRTLPLLTGEVKVDGVDLEYEVFPRVEDLFRRQAREAEFPVAEMSMSTFMVMKARGDTSLVGLPIFPSRHFRHREIYVNTLAGIRTPSDLIGKRVGVPEYQMTAALWIRAFLAHDYGVVPSDIRWRTGGLREPDFRERLPTKLPDEVRIERIPSDQSLERLLREGGLDALITTEQPPYFGESEPSVRRLFADYGEVEREYFRRTSLFPIMHLVVLRRDLYEEYPWLAESLTRAFMSAKSVGWDRMRFQPSLPVMLPWLQEQIEELDRAFELDVWPYGVSANVTVLRAMTKYAAEQGLTSRQLEIAELFAPETLTLDL